MRISEIILRESYADWGPDWIHFTKHPMLTINPKQMHQDPAGIYFFPARVTPDAEMWHGMPYKFTVNIKPEAHVLDVETITPALIHQLAAASGAAEQFNAYIAQYPPKDTAKMFDMLWEQMRAYYAFGGSNHRAFAAFNGMLRRMGYQAIFDTTGALHSSEKEQLLVLDPRIITNVRMEQKKGSGFPGMQRVVKDLSAIGREYGVVTASPITKPNAQTSSYGGRENLLNCRIDIKNPQDENNYASFLVHIRPQFPDRVAGSLQYSNPRLGYGAGVEYSIPKGQYMWSGLDAIRKDLERIFVQQPVMAEVRKVPGPQLVGSGKDFRQDAGHNTSSGKMPGRVAGSGKAMKVKPGFVG